MSALLVWLTWLTHLTRKWNTLQIYTLIWQTGEAYHAIFGHIQIQRRLQCWVFSLASVFVMLSIAKFAWSTSKFLIRTLYSFSFDWFYHSSTILQIFTISWCITECSGERYVTFISFAIHFIFLTYWLTWPYQQKRSVGLVKPNEGINYYYQTK